MRLFHYYLPPKNVIINKIIKLMHKRLWLGILLGALLGIFCIIGIGYRLGYEGNEMFLFAAWYNRVIMGILIGLAGSVNILKGKFNSLTRGALLGTLVSLDWFISTDFRDPLGFAAGIGYGIIIDAAVTFYLEKKGNSV